MWTEEQRAQSKRAIWEKDVKQVETVYRRCREKVR